MVAPQTDGWWYTYPSEKYEFISWDDDIPDMMGNIKAVFQTTSQINNSCTMLYLFFLNIQLKSAENRNHKDIQWDTSLENFMLEDT